MAKTTAQLSAQADLFGEKLAAAQQSVADLRAAAEKRADDSRTERDDALRHREQFAHARKELDDERALGRERDRLIADLRRDNDLLRQKLDDHLKRVEVGDARRWTLVGLFVAAILSFAGNLVATLVKT